MTLDMLHAEAARPDSEPAGAVTSGGTESILTALLVYREQAQKERGIDRRHGGPNAHNGNVAKINVGGATETEVKERKNLILFIDEAHTLIGAGGAAGTDHPALSTADVL